MIHDGPVLFTYELIHKSLILSNYAARRIVASTDVADQANAAGAAEMQLLVESVALTM